MFRKILSFTGIAVVGIVGVKFAFGLLGFAAALIIKLLWLAAIAFVIYTLARIFFPDVVGKVEDAIRNEPPAEDSAETAEVEEVDGEESE